MRAPILEAAENFVDVEITVVNVISAYAVQSDLVVFNIRGNAIAK